MAALESRSSQFILPDETGKAGQVALEGAEMPNDLQIKEPDFKARGAYPIVTYTWLLTRKHYESREQADSLKALLRFCMDDRQQEIAAELG